MIDFQKQKLRTDSVKKAGQKGGEGDINLNS
jgi:hypothetical protein